MNVRSKADVNLPYRIVWRQNPVKSLLELGAPELEDIVYVTTFDF